MADDVESVALGLSNEEAVSLFSSSLNKALEKQSSLIVNTITGLTEQLAKNNTVSSTEHVAKTGPAFEFKHEGHKIQFAFNQERSQKLAEIEGLVLKGNLAKAALVINEEEAALQQPNKILKIADRHGWDTVHEYLDDPLADGTEDAAKLRYAMGRATRKRAYRSRPYDRRRGGFAPSNFFRGFSQSYSSTDKFSTGTSKVGPTGSQFPRERAGCFYCRQVGHMVRECPYLRGQPIPTLSTPNTGGVTTQ